MKLFAFGGQLRQDEAVLSMVYECECMFCIYSKFSLKVVYRFLETATVCETTDKVTNVTIGWLNNILSSGGLAEFFFMLQSIVMSKDALRSYTRHSGARQGQGSGSQPRREPEMASGSPTMCSHGRHKDQKTDIPDPL